MGSTPHILGDPLVTPVKRDVMQSNEKYYFAGKCGRHLKMVTTMILEKVLVMNNRGASQILAEHVFEGTLAVRRAPNGDDIGHLRIRIEDCRGSLRLSNCQSASCGEQTKNVTQQLVTNIWHRVILFWQPQKKHMG
jgi:hypothetical protein